MDLCSNLWQYYGSSAAPAVVQVSETLLKSIGVIEENSSMVETKPMEKPVDIGNYDADILFLGAGPCC